MTSFDPLDTNKILNIIKNSKLISNTRNKIKKNKIVIKQNSKEG